jgi:hypothetical protein
MKHEEMLKYYERLRDDKPNDYIVDETFSLSGSVSIMKGDYMSSLLSSKRRIVRKSLNRSIL